MNRLRHRAAQSGFVMLTALVIMLAITIIGAITITSLLGEIQGEYGYNQAVSATGVAEAGLHWAINKMTGASATTQVYQGDPTTQTLQDAGGQQFGVFDVAVMCADGVTAVNAVSAGCNTVLSDGTTRPNQRLAKATGYVPTKAGPLGTRTLQALLSQNTFYNKTLCAYQSVTLSQGVAVQGDVGSEGTTNPDLTLSGPSGSAATINPAPLNVQPGNAYAVTSVNCSQACGAPANQVAGTVYGNQTPGSVCPKMTQVLSTYSCTPGSANLSGGSVQIDSTNNSLNSITLASGGIVTFVTAGKTDVLTVNVNTITAGSDTQFIIKNGGIVQLNLASQLTVGQRSAFGLKYPAGPTDPTVPLPCCPLTPPIPTSALVAAGTFIVRSCNTGTPSPAIWFNQAGAISAVFMAPNGTVKMDQAQVPSRGAILASNIVLDQGTNFGFDLSASAVGLGFNNLAWWRDVP